MAQESVTRKLAAILYADVAGYSRLTGADEVGTHRQLGAALDHLSAAVAAHGGTVVHYAGDAVLADFASVVAALECAVSVQGELASGRTEVAPDQRLRFRMGINLGEVIVDRDDIYGDGVNIAARLESLAEPGGICVSGKVYEETKNRLDVAFADMGEIEVKNIAEPVRAYRVQLDVPAADPTGAHADATPALPDKPSIAVLPFDNMSGDAEQEYFADGITEDIITALSNVRSFFVIGRNSTFVYKGAAVDVRQVGRDLGVHYVMEGSVRKAGNKVRVTAQLLRATDSHHVWADRYDGDLDDIFDLQDQITASVVGAIEPRLLDAEAERVTRKRPDSLDAYDYTLRGLALMNRLTPEDTLAALLLFEKAIGIDPDYGPALVCASWCYRRTVQTRGAVLSDGDRAESLRLAAAALKADPGDPYVMWQAAATLAYLEDDFDGAIALIDRSLSVNANANRAWLASGVVRCMVGDPATAVEHAERSMRLSPLDISGWVAHGVLATAHMQEERYADAAVWAAKSVRQNADNAPAHHVLAASCAQLGRMDEARAAARRALELEPDLTISRLQEIYPIARYKNLDGFLDGLRKAGIAQ